jgi:hypothetical protein
VRRAKVVIRVAYLDRRPQRKGAELLFFDWAPIRGELDPINIFILRSANHQNVAVKGKENLNEV